MDILHLHRESLVATGQYNKRLTGEGMCPLGPGQLRRQHEDQGGCCHWSCRRTFANFHSARGKGLAFSLLKVPTSAYTLMYLCTMY